MADKFIRQFPLKGLHYEEMIYHESGMERNKMEDSAICFRNFIELDTSFCNKQDPLLDGGIKSFVGFFSTCYYPGLQKMGLEHPGSIKDDLEFRKPSQKLWILVSRNLYRFGKGNFFLTLLVQWKSSKIAALA